jgi:apolipoprotein N-acyltransferase
MLFDISIASVGSILLVLGLPVFNQSLLPWFALVPLLYLLLKKSPAAAFWFGLVYGAIFFLGIFYWILVVKGYTYLHHTLLAVYLGSYIGMFGLIYSFVSRRLGFTAALSAAPFIWTSIEYFRSHAFFLSLPWGLLAHSQYQNPVIIQLSSVFGLWGVSFLIAATNAGLTGFILFAVGWWKQKSSDLGDRWGHSKKPLAVTVAALFLFSAAVVHGFFKVSRPVIGEPIRLSIVQGNIDQKKKWDPNFARFILQKYRDLSTEAGESRPQLIVWPETATPGSINRQPQLIKEMQGLSSEINSWILFGSADGQKFTSRLFGRERHNTAFLMEPGQKVDNLQKYHKIRLFPFGEYLPYKEILPWSWIGVSELGSYIPGSEYKIFEMHGVRFATTICWENLFPDLVREFVNRGAKFIINITNEAWFGETAAPEQFLSMSVFRAVENGVYVVRCSNTGISCFIDPCGRIVDRVKNKEGKEVFVSGFLTDSVVPLSSNTFYTRYGDWFPWLCIIISLGFISKAILRKIPDSA